MQEKKIKYCTELRDWLSESVNTKLDVGVDMSKIGGNKPPGSTQGFGAEGSQGPEKSNKASRTLQGHTVTKTPAHSLGVNIPVVDARTTRLMVAFNHKAVRLDAGDVATNAVNTLASSILVGAKRVGRVFKKLPAQRLLKGAVSFTSSATKKLADWSMSAKGRELKVAERTDHLVVDRSKH